MPRVSIILSTYNHMKFLPSCIDSILSQDYRDFELIIINDASTDGTKDYLDQVVNVHHDMDIKVIENETNQGIPKSYNIGLKQAIGEYVTWISSDNYYTKDFLSKLVSALDNHPKAILAYSSFHFVNESGKVIRTNTEVNWSVHQFLLDNPGVASFLYRSRIHKIIGYLDPDIGVTSDTDFWVRLRECFSDKDHIVFVRPVLCYFLWDFTCDSFKRYETTAESVKRMVTKTRNRVKTYRMSCRDKMHIGFVVCNSIPDHYGGMEVYTYNLIKELKKIDIDVSIIRPRVGDEGIEEKEYNGIEIYGITQDKVIQNLRDTIENRKSEDLFLRLLDKHEFDMFHVHHMFGFPFSILRLLKKMGYPIAVTLHDFWTVCYRMFLLHRNGQVHPSCSTIDDCVMCNLPNDASQNLDMIASTYYCMAMRQFGNIEMFDSFDYVSAPSEYVKGVFEEKGYRKIHLIPLGVSLGSVGKSNRKSPGVPLTFGYFGVIHPIKGISDMVEAYNNVQVNITPDGLNDHRLFIWGKVTDGYDKKFAEMIGTNPLISYFGPYTPDMIPEICSKIDVAIVPSITESYCFTVREAFVNLVPVIGRNIPALNEIINPVINGSLFNNLNHLTKIMEEVISNPKIIDQWILEIPKIQMIETDTSRWSYIYHKILGWR